MAQLQSLIENGTPLQTIVDQIAQSVGNSVQTQLNGTLPQQNLDQLKSSIVQQITNALAPPGTAPPGTPQTQAAQLVARLKRLVASIQSGATNKPGQQNEIAGNILDAKSAKDIPAQVRGSQTSSTLDVSSLVSSILKQAVTAQSSGTDSRPNYRPNPLQRIDTRPGYTPNPIRAAVHNLTPEVTQQTQAVAVPTDSTQQNASSSNLRTDLTAPPAISMDNAPDLLARMLVRAAGVGTGITGNSALTSAATATTAPSQNPTSLLARFEAAIANVVQPDVAASPSGGSFTSGQFGQSFGQQQSSQNSLGSQDSISSLIAAPTTGPTDPLQAIAQAQQLQQQQASVDANAVIEQMVKSMMMRTNSQGSSEIRLHLQPENLGDITMKITVNGNQISANVVAANADVRSALQSGHQQLAKSLANSGLTLSGFSVDVSGGDKRGDQNPGSASGFGRRYVVHELGGAASTETQQVSNLGPALMSGQGLELFNYLV